jgi:hypothetical protein
MLELTKKLELRYKQPPLPVLLGQEGSKEQFPALDFESHNNSEPSSPRSAETTSSNDVREVISMFEKK